MQHDDHPPVIGALSPEDAAVKLRELGDDTTATALTNPELRPRGAVMGVSDWWPFRDKPWQHTAHAFGYLGPADADDPKAISTPILPLGAVQADKRLRNRRVNVTLNRLRVADYPGSGSHRVLFEFHATNHLNGEASESLHFNHTYRVRSGERAALVGYPIFIGLGVGEGLGVRCYTVNVKNDSDEKFLDFLDSDVFKGGLKLATTAQPAIAPLSGLALGITRSIASRNRNVAVQDFFLGLDFSRDRMGARLAEGSYLAVQVPEKLQALWDWSDWVYSSATGEVVAKEDPKQLIPYNYVVIGITRHNG